MWSAPISALKKRRKIRAYKKTRIPSRANPPPLPAAGSVPGMHEENTVNPMICLFAKHPDENLSDSIMLMQININLKKSGYSNFLATQPPPFDAFVYCASLQPTN